jgi:hypothetical protein
MSNDSNGRLVWNHSTHLPGLIPILEKLLICPGITTITPGRIKSARGRCPQLTLRISVPIRGGYKAIARQGKTVQEVFILTILEQENLEVEIARLLN